MRICSRHCNLSEYVKENRKHARLMQKANKLGAQDLLEIAALKGISMVMRPEQQSEPSLGSNLSGSGGGTSASSVASSCSTNHPPLMPERSGGDDAVAVVSGVPQNVGEEEEDDIASAPENVDEDASL